MDNIQCLRDFIKRTRAQRKTLMSTSNDLEKALNIRTLKSNVVLSKKVINVMDTPHFIHSNSVYMKTPSSHTYFSTSTDHKPRRKSPEMLSRSPSIRRMIQIYNVPPTTLYHSKINTTKYAKSRKKVVRLTYEEKPSLVIQSETLASKKNTSHTLAKLPRYSSQLCFRNKSSSAGFKLKATMNKTCSYGEISKLCDK